MLQALKASRDPEGFFAACEARSGDPFCVALPGVGPLYLSGHPDGAKELFRADPATFIPVLPNPVEALLGPGSLILLKGARHRRERKLLAPPFHGRRMKAYGDSMRGLAEQAVAECTEGAVIDARQLAQSLTLLVIIHAIFGVTEPAQVQRVLHAIEATTVRYSGMLALVPAARFKLFGASPWDRFQKAAGHLDDVLREEIRARSGTEPGEDILSLLLGLRYEDGTAMHEDALVDELRTMLVAGHETAATALSWALGYVHHDARVLHRLRTELEGDGEAYLEAVCKEALRRHPAVPIVLRRLTRDWTFRGLPIPAGASVGLALTRLHTRPDTWARPLAFYPEHFLERTYTPFEYAPFGGGTRRCVGAAFASFELRVLLGTLLREGQFEAAGPLPAPVTASITMAPGAPIPLRFLGRPTRLCDPAEDA